MNGGNRKKFSTGETMPNLAFLATSWEHCMCCLPLPQGTISGGWLRMCLKGPYAAGDGHPRHCDWLYNVVYWLLVYCIISKIRIIFSYHIVSWQSLSYHIISYHITYCILCIIYTILFGSKTVASCFVVSGYEVAYPTMTGWWCPPFSWCFNNSYLKGEIWRI